MPIFIVAEEEAQVPQAPCKSNKSNCIPVQTFRNLEGVLPYLLQGNVLASPSY